MRDLNQRRERLRKFFRNNVPLDILEHRFARPELAAKLGYPREFPAPLADTYAALALDLTIDKTGVIIAHELNTANYQGWISLDGTVDRRCENEVLQTIRYARRQGLITRDHKLRQPVAVLFAHQPARHLRTGSEFAERVLVYCRWLAESLPGVSVRHRHCGRVGTEQVAVVSGNVNLVAEHLEVDRGRFLYHGRPVVFIGYPFVLAAMVRQGKLPGELLSLSSLDGLVDAEVFHGGRLLPLTWLKPIQQQLAPGSGIRALRHFDGCDEHSVVEGTMEMLDAGPVVLKPSATSGGAGVELVNPGASAAEIQQIVQKMAHDCRGKYGDNAEKLVFPVSGFEFVRSRGFHMFDGPHAWDLRFAALIWPGKIEVAPLTIRLAPRPFNSATWPTHRDEWISNVSGRDGTFVRSPFDPETQDAVGLNGEMLDRMCEATFKFTLRAIDWSWKQSIGKSATYEDQCDREGSWPYGRTT